MKTVTVKAEEYYVDCKTQSIDYGTCVSSTVIPNGRYDVELDLADGSTIIVGSAKIRHEYGDIYFFDCRK